MRKSTTRRNFITKLSAMGICSCIPSIVSSQVSTSNPEANASNPQEKSGLPKIWACLLQLSTNMWKVKDNELQIDEPVWSEALREMVDAGMNMVVIDLGDGIKYESHPEIAVRDAWTTSRLRDELEKIRSMGLEPIPKLNFSTGHDAWLGKYERMVSSTEYYDVCRDLIAEVIQLFDYPRFFHLGMDEEKATFSSPKNHVVVRMNDLYWGDLYFLIGEVFKGGSRPWVWQDRIRSQEEDVTRMMPKSVLQSNWYNHTDFDAPYNESIQAYLRLEKHGYDQVPGGSNYYEGKEECFLKNVKFCSEHVDRERLLGFIQSPWEYPSEEGKEKLLKGIRLAGEAKQWYNNNYGVNGSI